MLGSIEETGVRVEPAPIGTVLKDMKDLPFYEVVIGRHEDNAHLVTGNMKHFPREPFIVTANEFLEILNMEK